MILSFAFIHSTFSNQIENSYHGFYFFFSLTDDNNNNNKKVGAIRRKKNFLEKILWFNESVAQKKKKKKKRKFQIQTNRFNWMSLIVDIENGKISSFARFLNFSPRKKNQLFSSVSLLLMLSKSIHRVKSFGKRKRKNR